MQKKITAYVYIGKGEKVGQEPTRRVVTYVLCAPDVESSRILAMSRGYDAVGREGCPSELEGRTIEIGGDADSG